MARVVLAGVRKVYDNGYVAVENATFEAHDGELLVFVGPSGCGKSTLLRMIAGLEPISGGTISIGDVVVNDVPSAGRDVAMVFQDLSHTPHNPVHIPPKERDIAMVFQSYALYPHMTVYENMAFGLKLRGMPRKDIDARVQRASEILGLQPILDRTPRQLSGGQRQRVALGRALVREPAVFLLDEPLSNLDAKLRLQTRAEIAKLHRRLGTTMVYVTHDQIEAMTLGHRIVVLDRGHVQQIDTPLALYNRPANRFVAGFIGSPAMNFIEGQVIAEGGTRVFRSDDGTLTMPVRGDSLAMGPATMGIRPEDVRINVGSGPFTVELVEPIGNEVFVYMRGGENQIVMRMAPQTLPAPGAPVSVDIDEDKVHLFDRQTGVRM